MAFIPNEIVKSARPTQWIKNLALFAALVFTGNLFVAPLFLKTLIAIFIFSLAVSATYLFNDVIDRASDSLHPFKRRRPVASGALRVPTALFVSFALTFTSLYLAASFSFFFFLSVLAYILLQAIYSVFLKDVVVFDILSIAAGFILRVYAGAFVINAHLSVWFLLCVISLSLFLAAGKRRAELAILAQSVAERHRKTLSLYTPDLLDSYLAMFANAAWLSWALFTFFEPPPPVGAAFPFIYDLPLTLAGISKWLMVTIPVVIFGIMRYLRIIYGGNRAESPEKVLIMDKPLLGAVIFWGILVIAIIYGPASIR